MPNMKFYILLFLFVITSIINYWGRKYLSVENTDLIVNFFKPMLLLLSLSFFLKEKSIKFYLYFFPIGLFMVGYSKNIFLEGRPYYWIPITGYFWGYLTVLFFIYRTDRLN